MRQSPRLLQGSRAGRTGLEQPIAGSLPAPHTPHHPKTGAALNALIRDLEHDWQLGLAVRDKYWSPHKADKESLSEKVYGQIQHLFYSARPALNDALDIFKNTAPGFAQSARLNLLHGILKSKTQSPVSRAGTPLNEPPKSLRSEPVNPLCKAPTFCCTTILLPALCTPLASLLSSS